MVQIYNPNVVGKHILIDIKNINSDKLKLVEDMKVFLAMKTIIFYSFHRIFLEKIIALFCSGNFAGRGRAFLESSALALFNFVL